MMNNTSQLIWIVLFLTHFGMKTSNGFRVKKVDGVKTLLALQNEEVVMHCEEDEPMSYCGFIHPNGTQFSFAGSSLTHGRCHINLKVDKNDAGQWACRVGKYRTGLEVTTTMRLRVVGKLAALEPNVTSAFGKEVTLVCLTTEKMSPLKYCRFVSPSAVAFSIASHFDRNSSLLGKYFFPPNMSLDRGDCAVTIKHATHEDRGSWTCSAWLEEESREFVDAVHLDIEDTTMTPALTAVISLISTLLLVSGALAVLVAWKKCTRWNNSKQEIERFNDAHLDPLFHDAHLDPQFTIPQVTVQYVSIANEAFMDGDDISFKYQ